MVAALLALTGCGQSNKDGTPRDPGTNATTAQTARSATANDIVITDGLPSDSLSRFNDAKIYCLGLILFAAKNQTQFPTNLQQTLPYLREANQLPSGTNRFDILYHGSLDELPKPMTNGIIVLRSQPWRARDGTRICVYGFVDGHCEIHAEAGGSFEAWEKQHLARP